MARDASPHPSRKGDQLLGQLRSTIMVFGLNIIHNLTQIMLGGLVFSAFLIPNIVSTTGSFRHHVYLCTLGYFVLMAQGILAFSPFGWATQMNYDHKRLIHLGMQILGSIFVIIGSLIRIIDVSSNFNTGHGIAGWIAMILTICTLVSGLLSLISPKLMNHKYMKLGHALFGAATLCLAFITILYAFNNYYRTIAGDSNANTAICLALFALIGTLLMASIKNVKRIMNR